MSTRPKWSRRVFRLRGLPNRVNDRSDVSQMLSQAVGISEKGVEVCSLAKTCNNWESLPSKVATIRFQVIPDCLSSASHVDQWEFPLKEESEQCLILDTHFQGLTALNDVKPEDHHTDCIAISGLASHPFGSWQPHGDDKSFMWIRDELPRSVPGIRTIIYGYKSELLDSESFQTISQIALSFIHQLRAGRWNLKSSKPIIFLAHSLGGLVLKDAIVQIADEEESIRGILNNFKGAIMFGVPSLGMHQSHLMTMTKGQANEYLSQALSQENGNAYLRQLNKDFERLLILQNARIYWAYETKETRTVQLENNKWTSNGRLEVLVNPYSATCGQNTGATKIMTIPINENHSNIVKFSRGHKDLPTIIQTIFELCSQETNNIDVSSIHMIEKPSRKTKIPKSYLDLPALSENDCITLNKLDKLLLSIQELHELSPAELKFPADRIEDPFKDTFKWVFDKTSFSNWLQEGTGLFWVNGKPGSGKSTLMKYISKSPDTQALLHDWKRSFSKIEEIIVSFFFYYQGTALQKSFEGLLRSLIAQLISSRYILFRDRWRTFRQLKIQASLLMSERKAVLIRNKNGTHRCESTKETLHRINRRLQEIGTELKSVAEEFRQDANEPETRFLSTVTEAYQNCRGGGLLRKLETTLHQILNQDAVQMDIILFLDALDEFDGHLDTISKFLKGLVKDSNLNRVKVCFSSRPWKLLDAHFSKEPKFRLQDYTREDIARFATGSLSGLNLDYRSVFRLVNEINSRANGVFLWVRHAVKKMIDASSHTDPHVRSLQMENTLRRLPESITEFYQLIFERIAHSNRRNTYALLELLVRRRDVGVSVDYAWRAVTIAYCSTHQEIRDKLEKLEHYSLGKNLNDRDVKERQKVDIVNWGRDLVEINDTTVQAMHYSVLESITEMKFPFKRAILGDLSNIVVENGHSFHFKYLCSITSFRTSHTRGYQIATGAELRYHGEQSERTTKTSQLRYIRSLPQSILETLNDKPSSTMNSTGDLFLKFVVSHGLHLCLKEWVTKNPNQVAQFSPRATTFTLLSDILYLGSYGVFPDIYFEMMCLILQNGFSIQQDPNIFATVIGRIWKLEAENETREDREDIRTRRLMLHKIFTLLLDYGQKPNNSIHLNAIWAYPQGAACGVRPLHVLPPNLGEDLIHRGADPNRCDDHGRTPLDWILKLPPGCIRRNRAYDTEWRYSLCKILTKHGGRTSRCNHHDWMNALRDFELEGYNTTCLLESLTGRGFATSIHPTALLSTNNTTSNRKRSAGNDLPTERMRSSRHHFRR